MNQSKVLIKNQDGSIFKCQGGLIHVNLPGVSLHLNEVTFLSIARMMQKASSTLIDDGLRVLLDDVG